MSNGTAEIEEILRRPEAAALYEKTRHEEWLEPFFDSPSPVHRRLGAQLLIREMIDTLDPVRGERSVVDAVAEHARDEKQSARARRQAEGMRETRDLSFYCDDMRHLVCFPYSRTNLHRMARALDINPNFYHRRASYPHYDIPKRRYAEIARRCTVVRPRELLEICKGGAPPDTSIPVIEWEEEKAS